MTARQEADAAVFAWRNKYSISGKDPAHTAPTETGPDDKVAATSRRRPTGEKQ
jgi:hypothetical protein